MDRAKQWKSAKDTFVQQVMKLKVDISGHREWAAALKDFEGTRVPVLLQHLDQLDNLFVKNVEKGQVEDLQEILVKVTDLTQKMNLEFHNGIRALEVAIGGFKDQNKEPLVRGCKVLKTTLLSIETSNEAWLSNARDQVKGKLQRLDTFETMAGQFMAVLKAAVARGLAAAQRIKANPTKAVYDAEFPKAARDITQQVGNVRRLRGSGQDVPGPQDPTALFNALTPFADGALQRVDPEHATPNEILALTSRFNQAVKAVQQAYQL